MSRRTSEELDAKIVEEGTRIVHTFNDFCTEDAFQVQLSLLTLAEGLVEIIATANVKAKEDHPDLLDDTFFKVMDDMRIDFFKEIIEMMEKSIHE